MNINKLASRIAEMIREEIAGEKHVCVKCIELDIANDIGLLQLKALVCAEVGITMTAFESDNRSTPNIFARQLFIHIAINTLNTKATLEVLGTFINKDHCTVLHAKKRAQNLIDSKDNLFTELHNKITNHYA